MSDRLEQVKKIRDEAALRSAACAKHLKEKAPPEPYRKSGCSFCSHCRKKVKDGMNFVKKIINGE